MKGNFHAFLLSQEFEQNQQEYYIYLIGQEISRTYLYIIIIINFVEYKRNSHHQFMVDISSMSLQRVLPLNSVINQAKKHFLIFLIFTYLILLANSQPQSIHECDDNILPSPIYNSFNQLVQQPMAYKQFHEKFKKSYSKGTAQYELHCTTYYENVREIIEMAKTVSWNVGTNHLSDWTDHQKAIYRDLQLKDSLQNNSMIQVSQKQEIRVGLPLSLSWKERGKVSSIKNQGNCGACWSFAACAYGQSRILIKNDTQVDLSEQYLLSCTKGSDCSGGFLQNVFETAVGGIPQQSSYPYTGKLFTNPFICMASKKLSIGYIPVVAYYKSDQQLIQMLQTEPLAISISSNGWHSYKGGVFQCQPGSLTDHAVLLVGYTPDYWIIKNQWGEDWGMDGFMKITRIRSKNCNVGRGVFYMSEKYLNVILHLLAIMLYVAAR